MEFFQQIEQDIVKVWDEIKGEGSIILSDADKVVNMLMAFEASPTGAMIISGLESIFPVADPAINAISLALPVIARDMNWAVDELSKSDEEIWQEASAYLKQTVGSVKSGQLNTLKSLVGEIIGGIKESAITIQQLLTFSQPSHASIATN